MNRENKLTKLNEDLINLMMEKYNITYNDIKSNLDENGRWLIDGEDWFRYYTFTPEEYEEFRKKSIGLIRKTMRWSKSTSEKEFAWWNLAIGLSVKHQETNND